jgi:hypothetical protein
MMPLYRLKIKVEPMAEGKEKEGSKKFMETTALLFVLLIMIILFFKILFF